MQSAVAAALVLFRLAGAGGHGGKAGHGM